MQALLGPAILGLHFDFLQVTSAMYFLPLTGKERQQKFKYDDIEGMSITLLIDT